MVARSPSLDSCLSLSIFTRHPYPHTNARPCAEAGDDYAAEESEDRHCRDKPLGGEERGGAGEPWCPDVARFPGSPPGGGRVSDDGWFGWRGFVFGGTGGAADAGGGGPFGEELGVAAEFVADGGVEALDECAGLFDLVAGEGGFADIVDEVAGLLGFLSGDGSNIGLEIGDEVGVHGVGDELRGDGGIPEVDEEGLGGGDGLALGVVPEDEVGIEARFGHGDGFGGVLDGFEDFADLRDEGGFGAGGGAPGVARLEVIDLDLAFECGDGGEVRGGLAFGWEGGSVVLSEPVDADEGFLDCEFFVCHGFAGWW